MAFWTHGDKTGASNAKEDEWEGKCNTSFDAFGFQQQKNKDLKSIICARPFYKRSKQVPARFEYISKVYRDYKDTKYAPPELLEHFKQFDAIVANGEVETPNATIMYTILQRLRTLVQKTELTKLDTQLANLNTRQLKELYLLSNLNDATFLRPAIQAAIALKTIEGGRKSKRRQRRNRKTRRF